MTRFTVALLATALLVLPGCFGGGTPDPSWHKTEMSDRLLDIDLENCEWDATHKDQGDGNYVDQDLTDEQFEAAVTRCMQDKGYTWGVPEDENKKD